MGWAARVNPLSRENEKARTNRARWLVEQLGRARVEAALPQMPPADQTLIQRMLDEVYPVVLQ